MEVNEDDFMLATGIENSVSFMREWNAYTDKREFLYRHGYICARATKVSMKETENSLELYPDIDGVTIEWNNLAETSHQFHHLFLIPRGYKSIKNVYSLLKKHVKLNEYSPESRTVIRECVGTSIFTDSGWEYVIALIPSFDNNTAFAKNIIWELTLTWLKKVKEEFRNRLIGLISNGSLRRTLDKNNVYDVSQVFILPPDSPAILGVFQESVNATVTPQGFQSIIFSYRFGEKNRDIVSIPVLRSSSVKRMCVHVGISVEPALSEESVFWSRQGIENIAENRGNVTTCCSLFECANFQSDNYGSHLSVSGKLRRICRFPEHVHFVQLYADIPHRYPKTRYHPVSASVIFCAGLRNANDALRTDAARYISEIRSNFLKMTNSVCRLEFVMSLPAIEDHVSAAGLINLSNVCELLCDKAMIIPFAEQSFMTCLKTIGLNFCDRLQSLFEQYKGTGSSSGVWEAYQLELAVEKILWGHPLSYLSNHCAVNLGVGIGNPSRCVSDQYGFLRLENKFSCCSNEDTTPPLSIYSKSNVVQHQLEKMFGFCDYMESSSLVLGRRLVEIIVLDMYDIGCMSGGFGAFLASLKDGGHSLRVVSATSRKSLSQQLTCVPNCKYPMVFMNILRLLKKKDKNIESLIIKGLEELQLCYFPAFRAYDQQRNRCLCWHFSYGIWAVKDLCEADGASIEVRGGLLCAMVLNELERRKLCFTRSLTGTNDGFPWITACLRKLEELKLSDESLVCIMTFITCVAFLESGKFIDYNKLRQLEDQMPMSQRRLRDLEIQGQFLVNNMNKFMVWRLHHSIPRQSSKKISDRRTFPVKESTETTVEEHPQNEDNVPQINENDHELHTIGRKRVVSNIPLHMPVSCTWHWRSEELAIVAHLHEQFRTSDTTLQQLYTKYQEECRSASIPDRSYNSFRIKYKRLY